MLKQCYNTIYYVSNCKDIIISWQFFGTIKFKNIYIIPDLTLEVHCTFQGMGHILECVKLGNP